MLLTETEIRAAVEAAFADRSLLADERSRQAVLEAIELCDKGRLRVATQDAPGKWTTHAWVKQAVLLYFAISPMRRWEAGPFEFFDKIPLKHELERAGAYRVYHDPADLLRHVDEVGVRPAD